MAQQRVMAGDAMDFEMGREERFAKLISSVIMSLSSAGA